MHKIDSAGAVSSKPTAAAVGSTVGWFNNAPGSSPGTVVDADFLNTVQAEILAVLAAAAGAWN